MIYLGRHGILAPADLQLTGHGLEAELPLLIPQLEQQARHALFQAGEQIGKAGGIGFGAKGVRCLSVTPGNFDTPMGQQMCIRDRL